LSQDTPLAWSRLSRDQEHLASFPDLDLLHDRISARMYYAIRDGAEEALAAAPQFRRPLLLVHGEKDSVTSVAATREFFERAASADKTLTVYPGMLHETHNDLGRERVIADVIAWIEQRIGESPAQVGSEELTA
jgi:alpha-beta hydrolase superfamily lysophospholipase